MTMTHEIIRQAGLSLTCGSSTGEHAVSSSIVSGICCGEEFGSIAAAEMFAFMGGCRPLLRAPGRLGLLAAAPTTLAPPA